MLEFIPRLSDKGIEQIISDRYWIRGGVDVAELRKQLISLFEYSISKGKFLEKINHLLASFYNAYPDGYEPNDIALDLFESNQLEMLAGKSLAKYIKINGKPSQVKYPPKELLLIDSLNRVVMFKVITEKVMNMLVLIPILCVMN